jgi:Protein of unknown function (DUF3034)
MKTTSFVTIAKSVRHQSAWSATLLGALLIAAAPAASLAAPESNAAPDEAPTEAKAEKPPPLPLHQIEGNGGIFSTLSAYLVNPPRDGELLGRPSLGFAFVDIGHGRNLEAFTITETPWKRLELGYGYDRMDIGDLPQAVQNATGLVIHDSEVGLHNFNARLQLVKEGEFDQKWVPALTFGAHYKYNDTYNSINSDLKNTLHSIGVVRNDGVDFTLYASKLLTFLPRPVLVEVGGRATEGAHLGLVGFTDKYSFNLEANVAVFVTDSFVLAAEYRQKPNDYTAVPGLIKPEDDWWTIDAAYIVNKHLTLAVGYGHFGGVLNHDANGVWGITTKWEF